MNRTICIIYFIVSLCQFISSFFLVARGKRCWKTYMFLGCQLTSILWCFSQMCIYIAKDMVQIEISYNIGNLAICFIGSFWLGFAINFAGKKNSIIMILVFFISLFHYVIVLSNPLHYMYYRKFQMDNIQYGVFFYSNVAITYICILIGVAVIVSSKVKDINGKYQKKILVLAAVFPLVLNFLHQIRLADIAFDITPLGFCLSYLLVMIATFRYNFLDVNQLAFAQVIEEIQDGIIIFRVDNTCSFQNSMATEFFGGKSVETIEEFYGRLQGDERVELQEKGEVTLHRAEKHFQVQKAIHCEKNRQAAISFVIKNVSRYYELMEQSKKYLFWSKALRWSRKKDV